MSRFSLSRVKDAALEKALLLLLRPKFERYGEIRCLSLDTTAKTISGELRLLGDPIPIAISQARYQVFENEGGCQLRISEVKTSKEWLQNLIEDRFSEITIPLPDFVRPLL